MCTVGGPVDIDLPPDRVKGKDYRCKECGERFKGIGKNPSVPAASQMMWLKYELSP
jgi:ribosomal protein L37AE/L43A